MYENNRKQSQKQDILGNLEIPARTCPEKKRTYGLPSYLSIWEWKVKSSSLIKII